MASIVLIHAGGSGKPGLDSPYFFREDIIAALSVTSPSLGKMLSNEKRCISVEKLLVASSVLRSETSELAGGLLTKAPFICLIGKDILKFEIESSRLAMLPDFGFANTLPAFLSIRRGTRPRSAEQNLSTIIADIAKARVAAIRHSGGRALLARYWGTYVAFLRTSEGFAVIADPAASIPRYYTEQSGVFVIFSNLEKCRFLDRSGFSINEAFIAVLLPYDKIENGDTGLNEIGELLGGQRLLITTGGTRIDPLWDPREIALAGFDPPRDEAARLLRQTVMQVTCTWAGACADVAVSLSGGLDSSIVLNSLARSG